MDKQYKLVIFDLDGTLLNTISDLAAAGNYALSVQDFPTHNEQSFKIFVGNGIPKLVERMLPKGHSEEQFCETMSIFNEYYSAHKNDKTAPYSGIQELLDFFSERKIICAVNTNKAHNFSVALVRMHFFDKIEIVQGYLDNVPPKPSPEGVFKIAEKSGVLLSEILYVGDSEVDIETAKNAGVDVCSVLWGFRTEEVLRAKNPSYIAQNPLDIVKIFIESDRQK